MTQDGGALGPHVFSIPPSARFLDVLAAQLWRVADGDPLRLADIQVFLPTRRAARALTAALAASAPGRPAGGVAALIAPRIRPLGDLDGDEPPFEPDGPALTAPPAVSAARRLFELSRLVEGMTQARGQARDPAGALASAREIARVIDEIHTNGIADLAAFDADLRSRLPAHLADAAIFLDIVMQAWPKRLTELGAAGGAARRADLLRLLAAQWRATPPAGPVIAAGSTGTAPATAELLHVIARLDEGAVILPGLDRDLDDSSWDRLDEQHPQFQLKRLLARLEVGRGDVADLPGVVESPVARPRRRLIAQALLPAEASGGMLEGAHAIAAAQGMTPPDFTRAALDGLTLIEARNEEEEALACALAAREALETPGRTVMLVTPDRMLAARVSARLTRWGIEAQSSAGRPLAETPSASFLTLLLDLAREPDSTLTICALWKHPLCALGRPRPVLRGLAAEIERGALRGPRPADLRQAVNANLSSHHVVLLDDLTAAMAPLARLDGAHDAPARARALAEAAEAVARTPERPGAARVWAGEGGEGAAALIGALIQEGDALPALDAADFARLFAEAMQGEAVRPRGGEHPRLRILGPLEARLQSADLAILAGLNEGTWPTPAAGEPFLSRVMRRAIGLDAPERRIGQAAHDFAQLAGAPRVILSRSRRKEGAPAVASRFLWRLKTLAAGALETDPDAALAEDAATALARALDHVRAEDARPAAAPDPRPPLRARPRRTSATALKIWVRDPYAVYGEKILGLRKLDPVDAAPGPRERGTAIHDALESCFDALAAGGPAALEALLAAGEERLRACGLTPEELAPVLSRFRRAAHWLAENEAQRRTAGWRPVRPEMRAEWTLEGPGGPFVVVAKADRLDLGPGGAAIVDFKTGAPPGRNEVRAGFDLQMPVQAAMMRAGLFAPLPAAAPESLLYLKLGGGRRAGEAMELTGGKEPWTGEDYADLGLRVTRGLIAFFDDPDNPYSSQPRARYRNDYGDYDHLARRGEWAAAGGADAEGDSGEEGGE